MSTMTLSEMMAVQRESLAARPPRASLITRAYARVRALDLAPARRIMLVSLLSIAGFLYRHALVLCGCSAVVISAATISPSLGWLSLAAALFFLEARRR